MTVSALGLPLLGLCRFDSPLTDTWQAAQIARLTPTERARLARIDRPLRREQFVVGHSTLRSVLAATSLDDATIEVAADGSVLLHASVPVYASIAHSASTVAVVVAGVPVGVDLESMQPARDLRAAAAMLGLAAEDADDPASILRAWVAAEARLKAGPGVCARVWQSTWNRYQVAIAGVVTAPLTGVFDGLTGIYNPAELQWEAV
jgi:phosphopantetheinyl transferase